MDTFAFTQESPWGRCLSQFLQVCSRSGSAETYREYTRTLSLLFSETQKLPDDITQEDVLSFIYSPSRSSRNPGATPTAGTVHTRLAILKAFYSFASTYTVTGEDSHPTPILQRAPPTAGIRTSKPSHEYHALSYQEMEQLFSVIPTDTVRGLRDRAMFLTYFWTARRRNEIARLTWGDIEATVLIDEDGTRRDGWVYHFKNKGRATKDDIAELPLPAKQAIDKYLIASGRMNTIKPSDPLFVPTDMGNVRFDQSKQLTDTSINRRLKTYAKRAGLDYERISLHSFRHTSARMRYEAGEDILSLQRLLRHVSLDMTYHYISKLTTPSDPGAKRLLDRFSRFS